MWPDVVASCAPKCKLFKSINSTVCAVRACYVCVTDFTPRPQHLHLDAAVRKACWVTHRQLVHQFRLLVDIFPQDSYTKVQLRVWKNNLVFILKKKKGIGRREVGGLIQIIVLDHFHTPQ